MMLRVVRGEREDGAGQRPSSVATGLPVSEVPGQLALEEDPSPTPAPGMHQKIACRCMQRISFSQGMAMLRYTHAKPWGLELE